jgi:hypothetical protein
MSYSKDFTIEMPSSLASITAVKACNRCNTSKPLEAFYFSNKEKTKRAAVCSECVKSRMQELAKARPKKCIKPIRAESELTIDAVFHCLDYDKSSGVFTRKIITGGTSSRLGKPAGYINESGYVVLSIGGREIRAHRLVWFVETGSFPASGLVIDHINRIPTDNRFENLRAVPQKINAHNIVKPKKQNSCGYLGVKHNKKRFSATIHGPDGKPLHLGTFDTPELARDAYLNAKRSFYPEAVLL